MLLAAVVADNDLAVMREIDSELLLEKGPERDAYQYVRMHFDENRVTPDFATIADNTGIVLPQPKEPVLSGMGTVYGGLS